MEQSSPAVLGPVESSVRPAVAVAHGSDEHLTLLGAPWHWNLLHGVDRADMLDFGRACMAAEREQCAKVCDDEAAGFGGVAAGPMATERGKLVHEAMAAGAMNCAASIRGPNG